MHEIKIGDTVTYIRNNWQDSPLIVVSKVYGNFIDGVEYNRGVMGWVRRGTIILVNIEHIVPYTLKYGD